MKKLKYVLCILLIMILNPAVSPLAAIALSEDPTGIAAKPPTLQKDSAITEENGLIHPGTNCDPEMLIPGDTTIDPGIIIDYQP